MHRPNRPFRRHPATRPERRGASLGAALVIAALACGGGSPDLEKELDTLHSWTASVRLATEEQRAHATTDRYTSRLREEAERALADGRRTLAAAAHSGVDRARAGSAADSLEQAIHRLAAEPRR